MNYLLSSNNLLSEHCHAASADYKVIVDFEKCRIPGLFHTGGRVRFPRVVDGEGMLQEGYGTDFKAFSSAKTEFF